MVELGIFPAGGAVTSLALVATLAVVCVVVSVAAVAIRRSGLEGLVLMAVQAGSFRMITNQAISRCFMIELGAFPGFRFVAIVTGLAHCVGMYVVVFMAVNTIRRRVTIEFELIRMTIVTLHFGVAT